MSEGIEIRHTTSPLLLLLYLPSSSALNRFFSLFVLLEKRIEFNSCTYFRQLSGKYACYNTIYLVSNWCLEKQYAEVQRDDKESWEAFLRRIHKVIIYLKDGSIKEYDSVEAYFNRDMSETDNTVDVPFE